MRSFATVIRRNSFQPQSGATVAASLLAAMLAGCGGAGVDAGSGTASPLAAGTATPAARQQPNILLIMADDLGYNDLAINNDNAAIDTPNLDQLAREGMRFTRHYATAVCSPARVALLTGQYPERHGFMPGGRGISADTLTLPERLQQAGYATWHIGKWHMGDQERSAWPDHQGFDHWFGFLNQWRLAGKVKEGVIRPARPRYKNPWLQGDSEPGRHFAGNLDSILTDTAIATVSNLAAQGNPWFINLWYFSPHAPIRPEAKFADRYPNTDQGRYRALISQLDSNIGRLLAHLDAIDAANNTIVVVVSDNGGTNRELDNNAPFSGRKDSLTEGGLRTPLLIRWPHAADNGTVVRAVTSIQDIYPTLLDALELEPTPELDGISFYRSARGLEPAAQRPLLWEHNGGSSVLSADGRWRMTFPPPVFGLPPNFFHYDQGPDSTGSNELSAAPAEILHQLLELHRTWYRNIHTVQTHYQDNRNGTATVSGMDFQRTPGFGGYTFGIGIAGESRGALVSQDGVWSLSRTENTVTASFGDATLSGEVASSDNCHSIVVSGSFHRRLSAFSGPDRFTLNLYIDGERAQSTALEGILPVVDLTAPTQLGSLWNGSQGDAPLPPTILNVEIGESPEMDVESFSSHLCDKR